VCSVQGHTKDGPLAKKGASTLLPVTFILTYFQNSFIMRLDGKFVSSKI